MRKFDIVLIILFAVFISTTVFSQKSKDGNSTVTNTNTIVNEFTVLTADANAGSSELFVTDAALNNNGRFPAPLAAGDLLMIIQMQGASIKGNVNDSTWGEITAYNNCGFYEFRVVSEVPDNATIVLSCPLENDYTASGKVQVIRVPRYASLTVENGGVLSSEPWNGSTGGVLAVEVNGATDIKSGGSMNVTGRGFRGGGVNNTSSIPGPEVFASLNAADGGEKGESIAGYQEDYNAYGGRFSRGAPANGGGGGNAHNAGGGGGANAGNISNYTGNGNPDITTPGWNNAWELEYNGFSTASSSGGGKGGYTFALNDENALAVGPGDTLWEGDNRQNTGGKGGRPMDYSIGRLFLGGGGGSGDGNNDEAGKAGAGGGLVYLLSNGTVSGSGEIIANGENGANTTGIGRDAAGGGGGGGTVTLNASGSITGISVAANGGSGGNQLITSIHNPNESEGPGGGGGGGYIAISNGNINRTATGGKNGVTNSTGVTEFNANGATMGGEGITDNSTNYYFTLQAENDTICVGSRASLTATLAGATPPNTTIFWYDAPAGGNLLTTGSSFTTPVLTATTTYYLSTCPGLETDTVTVIVNPGVTSFTATNVCLGNATVFNDSSSSVGDPIVAREWDFGDGTIHFGTDPVHTYAAPGNYNVTLKIITKKGCTNSTTDVVTVYPVPDAGFAFFPEEPTINNALVKFTDRSSGAVHWQWDFGDGSVIEGMRNPEHTYSTDGEYLVRQAVTNDYGCTDTAERLIRVIPEFAFYAPNAFTPNNDGYNDYFSGKGVGIEEYQMLIYDRWGMLIFQTDDLNHKWDGRVQNGESNQIAQEDVYVWMVVLKDVFGKKHEYKGHVSLIR